MALCVGAVALVVLRSYITDLRRVHSAHKAFSPEGNISDETLAKRFEENLVAFMSLVEAARNYPKINQSTATKFNH